MAAGIPGLLPFSVLLCGSPTFPKILSRANQGMRGTGAGAGVCPLGVFPAHPAGVVSFHSLPSSGNHRRQAGPGSAPAQGTWVASPSGPLPHFSLMRASLWAQLSSRGATQRQPSFSQDPHLYVGSLEPPPQLSTCVNMREGSEVV